MIVRESPKSRVQKDAPHWPPRSPLEAIMMSPSARKKYENQRRERDVSPSPSRRHATPRGQPALDEYEDEDEDEEMLQLQLQAIETKLRLKRLQQAKKATEDCDSNTAGPTLRPGTSTTSSRRTELPRSQSAVQVPVSPIRKREAEEQKSPARVLLGIDKGLRAQDVSLKRAASTTTRTVTSSHVRTNSARDMAPPRIKSFSERMAESREKEKEREEKQARVERSRSGGFGLQHIDGLKDRPVSRAASSLSSGTSASATTRPSSTLSMTSDASRSLFPSSRPASRGLGTTATVSKYTEISQRDEGTEAPSFESFSGLHLKSRDMQHNVVTRTLEGKTIITIPQLLKTVKAPDYDPPDMENDYVIMGIIASKSSPLTPKNSVRNRSSDDREIDPNQTNKFMVIRLTDLKWELDLFLFDTGFSQFWKLTVGTLIAVLNPDIMPPRDRATGKFSLKLTSSDDTVLEIGTARDLGFCHSMRKDGKECGQWIDGRKTEFCDFHIELQVEKSKRGRMEVNTMSGSGNFGRGASKGGASAGAGRGRGQKADSLKREGMYHDPWLHETMYITPGSGSTARLLDSDGQGYAAQRAERYRRQLAEKEKERELVKKLSVVGSGPGADYMKQKVDSFQSSSQPSSQNTGTDDAFATRPQSSGSKDLLGLLDKKAEDVSLGPAKRKRAPSGKSITSTAPVGWSGAFKRDLLLSPQKKTTSSFRSTTEPNPAKKKARLLLPEKGIREPGRDSLGTFDVGLVAAMDDDDDDLEIV